MSIEERLSKVLKDKAVTVDSPASMPTNVRHRYRRRIFFQAALAVTVLAVVGSASVMTVSAFRDQLDSFDQDRALVPPGEVVHTTGLWKGTAETSINGKTLKAELRVEPGASPNDAPEAVLINTGEHPFGYGHGFNLERLSNGFWEPVRDRSVYPAVGMSLSPGGRSEPEILKVTRNYSEPWHLLPPGEYRITKNFDIDSAAWDKRKVFEVSARFLVE